MASLWHLPDGEAQEKRDKVWGSKPLSIPDMTVWDGQHIDNPPVEPHVPFHPLINPWTLAFDIFGYVSSTLLRLLLSLTNKLQTQRCLDQIMV
jgi:hypothetical protein